MQVDVFYVFPNLLATRYVPLAKRFVRSYQDNPSGTYPHTLHVIGNGGELSAPQRRMFDPLPVEWHQHDNYGKDIGAFQSVASKLNSDVMVCFGSHVHFHLPGWLDIMVEAYLKYGPSLYGAWAFNEPRPHIRTTAFWLPPALMNCYPSWIGNAQRYEFEHGTKSILSFAKQSGFEPMMVTRKGVFARPKWHHVRRDDCLFLDQHTDRIGYK